MKSMSPPTRWKDLPGAPVGTRELLGAAHKTRAMDVGALERGAARVSRLGPAPAAAIAGVAISLWAKLAAAGLAVGIVASVAVGVREYVATEHERADRAASPPPVVAPTVHLPSPVAAPRDEVPPPPEAAPPTVPTRAVRKPAPLPVSAPKAEPPEAKTEAPSSLSAELSLLEDARRKLGSDPRAALVRVAEHRARYPEGILAKERDLVEIDAFRRTGRHDEARTRGEAWLARDPDSLQAARLRAILASLPQR